MPKTPSIRTEALPFKPRARMLVLLGDQLIRDAGIAVFELVKNAYDADATKVVVTLSHIYDHARGGITIEDDGCGMACIDSGFLPGTTER